MAHANAKNIRCSVKRNREEGANAPSVGQAIGLLAAGTLAVSAAHPVGDKLGKALNNGIDKIGDAFKGE